MKRRILGLLIAAALLPACAEGDPEPALLAVTREGDETPSRLWALTELGAQTELLASAPGAYLTPIWSPDRMTVAVSEWNPPEPPKLYLLSLAGGLPQELLQGEYFNLLGDGAWSPDGAWFAFGGGKTSGESSFCVIRRDGSDRRELGDVYAFKWSPVGQRLAHADSLGLWISDLEASTSTLVATGTYWLDWSPDGSRLAFYAPYELPDEETTWGVFTCPASGGPPTRVSGPNVLISFAIGLPYFPTWSPDSTLLTYYTWTPDFLVGLHVTRSDTDSDIRDVALPDGHHPGRMIAWNPDSSLFVLYSGGPDTQPGQLPIHLIDRGGARVWTPPAVINWHDMTDVSPFYWSPDGALLAVPTSATYGVAIVDPARREVEFLQPFGEEYSSFGPVLWSPRGDRLLVVGGSYSRIGLRLWRRGPSPATEFVHEGHSPQWGDGSAFYFVHQEGNLWSAPRTLLAHRSGRTYPLLQDVGDFVVR